MATTEDTAMSSETAINDNYLQHNHVDGPESSSQTLEEPADRMEVSPVSTPQNDVHPQPLALAVPSDTGTPGLEVGDGTNAAPYGTRSRNRTGGIRPNYAEDKELDLMIEANGKIPKAGASKGAPPPVVNDFEAMDHDRSADTSVRRAVAAVSIHGPVPNGTPPAMKDPIPGTSTFSANPNVNGSAPQSKKRKQPGSSTTIAAAHTATNMAPKLRGGHTQHARQHHETNMMTFEGSGSRLNAKRELKADDGTLLSVNGA